MNQYLMSFFKSDETLSEILLICSGFTFQYNFSRIIFFIVINEQGQSNVLTFFKISPVFKLTRVDLITEVTIQNCLSKTVASGLIKLLGMLPNCTHISTKGAERDEG